MQTERRHSVYLVHDFIGNLRNTIFDFLNQLYTCKIHNLFDNFFYLHVSMACLTRASQDSKTYIL